ncbi:hypothetical protein [Paludibaculum fermentans]|uniref:hypothetical protein n=1 Tax=Paludibaculum fermentans TaxID=1473598 RepID=UPI003EC1316D
MITPLPIINKYKEIERFLEPLRRQVRASVLIFCDERGLAHVSRVKTLESLTEKIESGRFSAWSDLDDLVAFTIVVPTLSDEPEVLTFLQSTFEQVNLRSRNTALKAPDVFRFDSTRFIGRLKANDETAATELHNVRFEIQVRTAFEHAWAVTTHSLAYKSADVSWNHLRLAAQLKAAVEQMDTLILAFEGASEKVQSSVWPEIKAKASLKKYMDSAVTDGHIPVELTPKDWSRYVDNAFRVLQCAGMRSPDKISEAVQAALTKEVNELGIGNVPLSISLWQFTFACLCRAGFLDRLTNHWPLITSELELLYPDVKGVTSRFNYE